MQRVWFAVVVALLCCAACNRTTGGSQDEGDGVAPFPRLDVQFADVDESDVQEPGPDADTSCTEGGACDDGDPCTTDDVCHDGVCGGANVVCAAEGPCRQGTCAPAIGACTYTDVADGTACALTCFDEATCQAGACTAVAESPVQCPASDNPCIEALECDLATGECTVAVYRPAGADCDTDDDVCSLEACDGAGSCASTGEHNRCEIESAENPCWTYVCNGKSGCATTSFVEGASCNDNNPCTSNDTCGDNELGQQTCLGTPIPIDDDNVCTDDACDEGDITHTPLDGAVCDLASPCSELGTCSDAVCQPITPCECLEDDDCEQPDDLCAGVAVCDHSGEEPACLIVAESVVVCDPSAKSCQTHDCNPSTGLCEELPAVDGAPCSDDDACTGDDACLAGACTGGFQVTCDDDAYCNGVEGCDVATGCTLGTPPELNDGVACTVDSCDEDSDAPAHTPDDTVCDNGAYCDGSESCDAALDCQSGTPPELDDGVACTVDSCDEDADAPAHTPDDTVCDNGAYCDGSESCDAALDCQSGTPPELDDGVACTVDSCDEDADAPLHTPDDTVCDNGAYCDGSESCDAALDCQSGTPPELDDGVACTVDSCDEAGDAVLHTPDPSLCDDDNVCTAESCDVEADCVHAPIDAPCSDDDPCTGQDACVAGDCLGAPILSEGPLCNNVDDDCDGVTDEDCTFRMGGHVMGGGFVTASDDTGLTMDGAAGTRRFVGTISDDTYILRSGLPPRGEGP